MQRRCANARYVRSAIIFNVSLSISCRCVTQRWENVTIGFRLIQMRMKRKKMDFSEHFQRYELCSTEFENKLECLAIDYMIITNRLPQHVGPKHVGNSKNSSLCNLIMHRRHRPSSIVCVLDVFAWRLECNKSMNKNRLQRKQRNNNKQNKEKEVEKGVRTAQCRCRCSTCSRKILLQIEVNRFTKNMALLK